MKNVLDFPGGYSAVIGYDSELEMFRGEFVGLNGGADFYATDLEGLKREGALAGLGGGRVARALPVLELVAGAALAVAALGLLVQSL